MKRIDLHDEWTIQTSRKVQAKGDAISTLKFQTEGWYRTSVPMTVLAAQVAAGEFPDPYYGMNLRTIDAYPVGEISQSSTMVVPDRVSDTDQTSVCGALF